MTAGAHRREGEPGQTPAPASQGRPGGPPEDHGPGHVGAGTHTPGHGSGEAPSETPVQTSAETSTPEAPSPGAGGRPAGGEPASGEPASHELALAQTALAERTLDLQRLQAEYVNYKRRVDRDRDLVRQNATFAVLSSLLPVLDDIDRAREHGELEGGFKAVAESLERAVNGLGLSKFGATGDPFDPNLHEALMHGHSPEVTATVVDVVAQAGYRMGERVVRAAKVTVLDPQE